MWEIRRIYAANTKGEKKTTLCSQMQRWIARKFKLPLGTVKKIVLGNTWRKPSPGKTWEQWEKEQGLDGRDSP